jgi:hypothetical protein
MGDLHFNKRVGTADSAEQVKPHAAPRMRAPLPVPELHRAADVRAVGALDARALK